MKKVIPTLLIATAFALTFVLDDCSSEEQIIEPLPKKDKKTSDVSKATQNNKYFVSLKEAQSIASVIEHPKTDSKDNK